MLIFRQSRCSAANLAGFAHLETGLRHIKVANNPILEKTRGVVRAAHDAAYKKEFLK